MLRECFSPILGSETHSSCYFISLGFSSNDDNSLLFNLLLTLVFHLLSLLGGHIGVQYVHIPDKDQCDWIRERVEIPRPWSYTTSEKRSILDRLMWSELFEQFIATKFPTEKRFGLEGCEALIPGMKALIDRSVDSHGVKAVTMGMPHRGRLNVLANVIRKPIEAILNEFTGGGDEDGGDVKYRECLLFLRRTVDLENNN